MKRTHDKKTLANEYCLCREIPHEWVGNNGQLIVGEKGEWRPFIYSVYNIPYAEIISTIDSICDYDEFGKFVSVKGKYSL